MPNSTGSRCERRFLYAVDAAGKELAGSRRDITDVSGDWRAVFKAEGDLRRLIGEDCEIVDRVVHA